MTIIDCCETFRVQLKDGEYCDFVDNYSMETMNKFDNILNSINCDYSSKIRNEFVKKVKNELNIELTPIIIVNIIIYKKD